MNDPYETCRKTGRTIWTDDCIEEAHEEGILLPDSPPTEKEVCPTCRGKGTHVNPSIDGNGITESEMYDLGEDFREDYFSGVFDVTCHECRGLRVIDVIQWKQLSPEVDAWIDEWYRERRMWDAEREAEIRFGA